MPNPWDAFLSEDGDESPTSIHTAVGLAISNWSDVEASLGALFVSLITVIGNVRPALRAFGAIESFEAKLNMLRAASREFHRRFTDQSECHNLEVWLKKNYRGWGARRNELAHGAVRFRWIDTGPPAIGRYFLLPTWFSFPKHSVDGWKPSYQYNSVDVEKFALSFKQLEHDTRAFMQKTVDLQFSSLRTAPEP